jgi:uroporphyrinogen-III decarboxylase
MKKAKEALAGHSCIMGGVPHTMMQIASPGEIEDFVKDLIKTCGKNGGLIISTSTGLTHEAKPENVRAMIEATKKYGRYQSNKREPEVVRLSSSIIQTSAASYFMKGITAPLI